MSVRDRIAQQEAQRQQEESTSTVSSPQPQAPESISEMLSALSSMGFQQVALSQAVAEVVAGQNEMVQLLKTLSTSQGQTTDSSQQLNEVLKGNSKIAQTMDLMSEVLSSSKAVLLPDGSRVSQSSLDAHSLMTKLQSEIQIMTAGVEKLAAEVHKKSYIEVDQSKVANAIAQRIEKGFDEKIEESAQRFQETLKAQQVRVEALGEAKLAGVTAQLAEAQKAVQQYQTIVTKLGRGLTWSGVGSVALALIPFAIAGLALATLIGLGGTMLGIGPLSVWAWDGFWAAKLWWQKALIGAGIGAGLFGAYWLLRAMGRKLADTYKNW